jgi:DNA-binding transcriptional MerR regulator
VSAAEPDRADPIPADAARADVTPAGVTPAGETGGTGAARRNGKSAAAFWTTGEVADALDLPAHVLRFWESRFAQIRPLKRAGGRRYYRPQDVELLRRIRHCLYRDGYTIRGVQKLLRDGMLRADQPPPLPAGEVTEPSPATPFAPDPIAEPAAAAGSPASSREALRAALEAVQRDLQEIRALLDKLVLP